jgi:hypothetical protein
LSARAFADRTGIRPSNLWRWKSELVAASHPAAPGFVPVVLRTEPKPHAFEATRMAGALRQPVAEIVCHSGRVVRVFADFDASLLASVIRVAEREATC